MTCLIHRALQWTQGGHFSLRKTKVSAAAAAALTTSLSLFIRQPNGVAHMYALYSDTDPDCCTEGPGLDSRPGRYRVT